MWWFGQDQVSQSRSPVGIGTMIIKLGFWKEIRENKSYALPSNIYIYDVNYQNTLL